MRWIKLWAGEITFNLIFADKRSNSTELQLADSIARPASLHLLRPTQPNSTLDVLKTKFYGENQCQDMDLNTVLHKSKTSR